MLHDRQLQYVQRFGVVPLQDCAGFRVWAPAARSVEVAIDDRDGGGVYPLARSADGVFTGCVANLAAGTRYWYRLDGGRPLPDPASRFQPEGVHGPSQIVDPTTFIWTDADWRGIAREALIVYELHVGTFTEEGTFAGVESRLGALADLGVTAVELMPVAAWPGRWNWGYDGAALFAPCHRYGTPDDLRRLVNAAHAHGLAVILDVVYNHFGPDGAYVYAFSDRFRTEDYHTPWGAGVNLDGDGSRFVRDFLLDNALHWIHEYHVDGLRLDAVHAMRDESSPHFLAELADVLRASTGGRELLLIAEDERNQAAIVADRARGGCGFDGVWADDFHHQVRRAVAGDDEGYFRSYSGTAADIAETLRCGWFFKGQYCAHAGAPRGSDPAGIPLDRFVICLQNHDQIGNRPHGERLHHQIDNAAYRAVSALLALAPETPMLFMGQEWAASTPFLYFTDHEPALGATITEGRRAEFAAFAAFADPLDRQRIPDPQDPETFRASCLHWDEREAPRHAAVLRLYVALLHLRRSLVDRLHRIHTLDVRAVDEQTVLIARGAGRAGPATLVVVRLREPGVVALDPHLTVRDRAWQTVLTTEDPEFAADGRAPSVHTANGLQITFHGPAAVVLQSAPAAGL